MKKKYSAFLLLGLSLAFLVPLFSRADTQYFWSSSPSGYFNNYFQLGRSGFTGSWLTYSLFDSNFVSQPDFLNANFIDARLTFDPVYVAAHGSDALYVNVCKNGNFLNCPLGLSATSTPITLQYLSDNAISTSTWTRFEFSQPWSWVWGTTTPLMFHFICLQNNGSICGNDSEFKLGVRTSDLVSGYITKNFINNFETDGEAYVRVGKADLLSIQRPVDGLLAPPGFTVWQVRVPADVVAQIPNLASGYQIQVQYGHTVSGSYQYTDVQKVYYSSLDYAVLVYPLDPLSRNDKFDLGSPFVPVTWYAVAKIYADSDGNGTFDQLIDTSPEISFVYYPQSTIFSNTMNEFYGTTTGSFITFSSTSTCPAGIVCNGTNGTRFYVDSNGNIVNVTAQPEVDSSWFGKFYALWQPLQYKPPWGYITLIAERFNSFGSSTASTTLMASSTSWVTVDQTALLGYAKVLSTPLAAVKFVFGAFFWFVTAYVSFKSIVLFI